MIVSCPACNTHFRVDEAAIPPSGRKVRCKSCQHMWLEVPPGGEALEAQAPFMAPTINSETVAPRTADATLSDGEDAADASSEALLPGLGPTVIPGTMQGFGPRRQAETPSRRLLLGWVSLAAVVVVVLAALGVFRDQIATAWPPAARLYAAIGWPTQAGSGLQMSQVKIAFGTSNDKPTLTLSGNIADHSWISLPIPKLHVFLLADSKQVLRTIEMDAGKPDLRPGETMRFSLNIDDPPREASSVRIAFATP